MDPTRSETMVHSSGQAGFISFGAWEWDLRANVLKLCDSAKTIVGLAPQDEVTFETLLRATHPEDSGFNEEALKTALDFGQRRLGVLEWRALRSDGSFRWVLAHVQSEKGETDDCRVLRYFGAVQDIDHYKRAALALPKAKARLALALDAGKMGLWEYDVQSEKLTGSCELNELIGFPRDAKLSIEDVRATLPPGESGRLCAAGQRALEGGDRSFEVEYNYRRPDDKVRRLLLNASFLPGSGGSLERIVGVLTDVTSRQAADTTNEPTNAYLAAVVSSSADAIVTFDHAGDILTWNEAAERIFGWSKDEAIGKPWSIVLPQESQASQPDPLEKVWSGEVAQFEGERRRKYGRLFHASITAAPVRAPNGRIVSVVITVRDATARRNSERRLSLLVRELHHRVRNTLATVQAIAGASARHAHSLDEFRESFSQRISSLAQAHALLTEDNWQSVDLRRLMLLELKPYADLDRTTLTGPDMILDAQSAIPVGMAIHELTTNAAKHGALSTRSGCVDISWSVFGSGEDRELDLFWSEHGGPRVKRPSRRGFGSLLLNTILKMQLGAEVEADYAPEGLQFRLRASLQEPVR